MSAYPLRVSRADAIAIVNRGGDYVVHAARPMPFSAGVQTACGRVMRATNDHDADTSCKACRRVLDALDAADR